MHVIKIRTHHLFDFVKALELEEFREKVYLKAKRVAKDGFLRGNGFCYDEKEIEPMKKLLASVTDETFIEIVEGMDDICKSCIIDESVKQDGCIWPDSFRDEEAWGPLPRHSPTPIAEIKKRFYATVNFLKTNAKDSLRRRYSHELKGL